MGLKKVCQCPKKAWNSTANPTLWKLPVRLLAKCVKTLGQNVDLFMRILKRHYLFIKLRCLKLLQLANVCVFLLSIEGCFQLLSSGKYRKPPDIRFIIDLNHERGVQFGPVEMFKV